ncbi:SVP1-like protein 2 [Candida viswanathii]|uniref:SVP1-like protein 2 n=1 Tax=Candida viswanathii TaxID=5486 RepID=A0A367XQF0_9ASCO|nr:SVP1-like protein 2 [Candida viswanathii]
MPSYATTSTTTHSPPSANATLTATPTTVTASTPASNTSTTSTTPTTTTTPSSSTAIPRILCMNFNQDQGCFAISHEQGFLVYNTNPIELRVKRNFTTPATSSSTTTTPNNRSNSTGSTESASSTGSHNNTHTHRQYKSGSGISHITMLHRTNYLALVGGGEKPRFPPNKLIIWDDLKRKTSLLLEFNTPVLNVLLSRVRIIVVLIDQIIVYGFAAPPKKFHTYNTISNEFGIADLSVNSNSSTTTTTATTSAASDSTRRSISPPNSSSSSNNSLKDITSSSSSSSSSYQTLAFPGRSVGQIQIVDVGNNSNEKNSMNIIKAHKLNIRCLCLNKSGTLVASASITGTLIRIHSTRTTTLLYEFRRGIDKAVITSMKFSHDDSKLAVLSDKHTLHVYNIDEVHGGGLNRHHVLNNLPYLPNYFKSTWSFCSVNTNKYHENNDSTNKSTEVDEGTIGWSGDDSIIIIWKLKKIWEKYVIVESENHTYELIRSSWKKLDNTTN